MQHSASITGVADFDDKHITGDAKNESPPSPFERQGYDNLTSAKAGARVLWSSDDWFASADCLLKDGPPIFDRDAYCEQGKVMDGWETRRRREAGHDWCVIKLASRSTIAGIEIDTAHFTGNHVPAICLEVADMTCDQETKMVMGFPNALERLLHGSVQGTGSSPAQVEQAEEATKLTSWHKLLPKTTLRPGYESSRMHYFTLEVPMEATHLRVNYYPDGGVARVRLWGLPTTETQKPTPGPAYSPIKTGRTCTVVSHTDKSEVPPSRQPYDYPDLACRDNGGVGLACSNKHYGDPWNLIQANLGQDMGDGWETARHPERPPILVKDPNTDLVDSPLMDWCVVKLGKVAEGVARIILDTKHFRGNYPESVQVEGCYATSDDAILDEMEWFPLVPRGRMAPDSEHIFDCSKTQIVNGDRKVSHVKVSIYPDGGISRVRVYGAAGDL